MTFDELFLSKREKERRRAEALNRRKQQQEDEPPKLRKHLADMDVESLVKLVNQRAFLAAE